jgi:hypothetical protein
VFLEKPAGFTHLLLTFLLFSALIMGLPTIGTDYLLDQDVVTAEEPNTGRPRRRHLDVSQKAGTYWPVRRRQFAASKRPANRGASQYETGYSTLDSDQRTCSK